MRVTLYLKEKKLNFNLPNQVSGSFSFYELDSDNSTLINIESRDGEWVYGGRFVDSKI